MERFPQEALHSWGRSEASFVISNRLLRLLMGVESFAMSHSVMLFLCVSARQRVTSSVVCFLGLCSCSFWMACFFWLCCSFLFGPA